MCNLTRYGALNPTVRFIRPSILFALLILVAIWLLQVKEELISSPRSLKSLTDSRWMLFKWYWKLCLKDLAIVRTLHLVPLKKSFQISLQRVKIFKSFWRSIRPTWRPGWGSNPRSPTFQAGRFSHCTSPRSLWWCREEMTRLRQVTVSSRTHKARIEQCQVEQPKFDHTVAADKAAADKAAE